MIEKTKNFVLSKNWRPYVSVQAISMYVIAIIALSVAWSSSKIVQRNYRLQQQISVLEQEADIANSRVENQKLLNKYYESNAFLELAARRQFNKAADNEKLLIVPKSVALSKVPTSAASSEQTAKTPQELSNWQSWLQFLTGRALAN